LKINLWLVLDYKVTPAGISEFGRIIDGYIQRLSQAHKREKLWKNWDKDDIDEVILRSCSSTKTYVLPVLIPDIRVGVT
jgi:hypothetical protein